MKIYKENLDDELLKENEVLADRGFITIATGKMKYHKLAYHLLLSYRLSTKNACRFAVITDKETEYTECFDDIIVIKNVTKSYMDKIALLMNTPYKETIFIDADCLAFNDLNKYWKVFSGGGSAFSAFGKVLPSDAKDGWFSIENAGKYKERISNPIDFHGGIYYIRKDEYRQEMYDICKDVINNYESYKFKVFKKPADEPILAFAMAVLGFEPIPASVEHFVWLKRGKFVRANFAKKKLSYIFGGNSTQNGMLLHFGTVRTGLNIYQREASRIKFINSRGKNWNIIESIYFQSIIFIKSLVLCFGVCWKRLLKKFKI